MNSIKKLKVPSWPPKSCPLLTRCLLGISEVLDLVALFQSGIYTKSRNYYRENLAMELNSKVNCDLEQCVLGNFCPHKPPPYDIRIMTIRYEKGDTIFTQGDPVTGLYVLCKGKVWFEKRTKGGKKQIFNIVGQGSIFGRSSLRERKRYFASARTLTECLVLYIDKRDLPRLAKDPDTALKIMRALSKNIHDLQHRLLITSYGGIRSRLANSLLMLSEKLGREVENGITIDLKLTKTDLSQIAGCTRESASTHLLWMKKNGLINYKGKYITLLDKEALGKL